ncbi:MAG: 30S ribosomal protein S16 [Bacteroidia bacterium]
MSVKIRLQRFGRKQAPYYHVVVADSRAPRDGKFIEKIGSYRPSSQPAQIELDVEKAVQWLFNGAQPTDTARAILSYKGALYKKHLIEGVKKGALTQEQADEKFNKWLEEKNAKINAHTEKVVKTKNQVLSERLAAETKVKEERAAKIAAKLAAANAQAAIDEASGGAEEPAPATEETPAE